MVIGVPIPVPCACTSACTSPIRSLISSRTDSSPSSSEASNLSCSSSNMVRSKPAAWSRSSAPGLSLVSLIAISSGS